jgi:diguanylate cyclase (GGDEF)-like protein
LIQREYAAFAEAKGIYDQIRFLDSQGQERVRINYTLTDGATIVAKKFLQNKRDRYYFQNTISLSKGKVYLSPLDLNVENNTVETPYKPMIRFGIPVFDTDGTKQGVIILNYLASHLLNNFTLAGTSTANSASFLLNEDGYWLKHPNPAHEWGFMLPERQNQTFAAHYPNAWRKMQTEEHGQFLTDSGLFTFIKISPLDEGQAKLRQTGTDHSLNLSASATHECTWYLVSFIDNETFAQRLDQLRFKAFALGAGLFAFVAFGAWHIALFVTKRKIYQAQLVSMALYDPLTNLPNRKLFFDRLEASLQHCKRYDRLFAVLYIDLDGFKAVNDQHGHEAGDALLIAVGKILTDCSRSSDTVARLGGDEFALILSEIKATDNAGKVAEKIIAALSAPITLQQGTVTIGASIGIAVYPMHATAGEEIVKTADQAMYQAKNGGKNRYVMGITQDAS